MVAVVVRVENVSNHPTRDGLTVNTLSNGAIAVSNLRDDGSARYAVGDCVVHIPEKSIVPEWLLRHQHCWDDEKGKGTCAGSKGNRVKNRTFDGIVSEGMLFALDGTVVRNYATGDAKSPMVGEDVSEFLGITDWVA